MIRFNWMEMGCYGTENNIAKNNSQHAPIIFNSESFFSVSKRMFSNFKSRWTTLFAWQYATAVRMEWMYLHARCSR